MNKEQLIDALIDIWLEEANITEIYDYAAERMEEGLGVYSRDELLKQYNQELVRE